MVRRSWTLFASPLAQPQPAFTGCAHAPCFHEGQHAGFSPTRRVFTRRSLSHSRFHWLAPTAGLYRRTHWAGLYRRTHWTGLYRPRQVFTAVQTRVGLHHPRLVFTVDASGWSSPPSAGLYRRTHWAGLYRPRQVFTAVQPPCHYTCRLSHHCL